MRGSEKLKEWRDERGLSQTKAAETFGVDQGVWGAWERDEKRPSLETIFALQSFTAGKITVQDWLGPRTGKKPKAGAKGKKPRAKKKRIDAAAE
jgi:transcriptional regulator with XRE-family HTH domain